jgi:hypothetical protein
MRTSAVVHIYCRSDDEWVVFQAGDFASRVVDPSFERILEIGQRLSRDSGIPLRIHADNGRALDMDRELTS